VQKKRFYKSFGHILDLNIILSLQAFHRPLTPIFKKGRRNNVEDYRGVAILSAIPKRFELLIYRTMYDDLKNLISVKQHGFMKNPSKVTNLLEYAFFVLNSIEEGWQVNSVYTDFLKVFDRVRHQLLLEEMSMGIEPARCLWLRSYLTGRIQRIRIGDAVSNDIRCPTRESSRTIVFYLVCQ
jgi:hypothetical protein